MTTTTVTVRAEGDRIYLHLPEPYPARLADLVGFLRQELPGVALDWVAVKEAFVYGRGRPFPIANRRPDAGRDERAKIRFSADGLVAYLLLFPPRSGGLRLEADDLADLAAAYGIPDTLLDRQALRMAGLRRTPHDPEPIARGRPPVDGEPARMEWHKGWPTDPEGFLSALAAAGDYPSSVLAACRAGETLGVRRAPGTGDPGVSATGAPVPARPGADPVELGDGLTLPLEGDAVVAAADGHLQISGAGGGRARLLPLLAVRDPQELKPWSGTVLPGSVVVEGDLEIPFPLLVLGDVEVHGGVIRSPVEVLGSLFVRDGIIQHAGRPVRAGGIVSAAFYDRAWVEAHTVHVRRYSLKSRLAALEGVLTSAEGSLQGGRVTAGRWLEAAVLGSENAMPTAAEVGVPGCAGPFEEAYRGWAEVLEEAPEAEGWPPVAPDAAARWRARSAAAEDPDPRAVTAEAGTVFAGVTVRIGSAARTVEHPVGPVGFTFERIGPRGRVAMARRPTAP